MPGVNSVGETTNLYFDGSTEKETPKKKKKRMKKCHKQKNILNK